MKTIAQAREPIATKADIATTKADIGALRSETQWMFGFLAAFVPAVTGHPFGLI